MAKYKKEKKVHDELLNLLKEHFFDDEMEMKDDDEEVDEMSPMEKSYEKDESDMDFGEDSYDSEGEDDEYYDDVMEENSEEEDEERRIPKDKRKNMAIVIATKKAGRRKRKAM